MQTIRSLKLTMALWYNDSAKAGRYWQYDTAERQKIEQAMCDLEIDWSMCGYRITDTSVNGDIHVERT